ncbi:MAG: FAD-dependent monooxygenase [Myxococcota bacterium]
MIVVGAGPAGAALSYLLARRGLRVTLLERHTDFSREFRGEALLPGGLEVLEQMGLWEAFEDVPHVSLEGVELYLAGHRRTTVSFGPATFGKLSPRWTSQPALLEMLCAQAAHYPGYHLERGATARGLVHEGGRCVGVRVLTEAGERELRGDLVVGADGRSSMVRKRSGLVAELDPTPMDVVWCKLPLPEAASARTLRAYLGRGHLLIAVPVYDGRLQVAWIIPKGSFAEVRDRGMPACLEEMARHVSPDLAEHLRRHRNHAVEPFLLFTVSDRVREWTRPGLLLLGDAAHTMSPVGGQGINIALRDAVVAANHLVPVLEAKGSADAIDAASRRVQEERVPEVARIQALQARAPRVIFNDAWWAQTALRLLVPLAGPASRIGGSRVLGSIAFGVTRVELQV